LPVALLGEVVELAATTYWKLVVLLLPKISNSVTPPE
jgi:hypothetical protein